MTKKYGENKIKKNPFEREREREREREIFKYDNTINSNIFKNGNEVN